MRDLPPARTAKARQRGSFLLEALIAALIVALGILGLVGLQARAIQNVDDAQYRSEAAFLANDLLGRMWTSNQATLQAEFETGGGTPYDDFKTLVQARLPGASVTDPTVTVAPRVRRPHDGLRGRDHDLLAAARRRPAQLPDGRHRQAQLSPQCRDSTPPFPARRAFASAAPASSS